LWPRTLQRSNIDLRQIIQPLNQGGGIRTREILSVAMHVVACVQDSVEVVDHALVVIVIFVSILVFVIGLVLVKLDHRISWLARDSHIEDRNAIVVGNIAILCVNGQLDTARTSVLVWRDAAAQQ
jgi:hypothetical protein